MASNLTSPPDSDRESSVDQMMERLKQGQGDETPQEQQRELVIREDGTQTIKVRKRKRRTQQPKKSATQLSPKVKWSILGSVIILVALAAISIAFITAKYNGQKFKDSTAAKIAEITGATQSTLTKLKVTPLSAQADKYELVWDKHSFIKEATFDTLKADIKAPSFFSSNWRGNEIVATGGTVTLQKPVPEIETSTSEASSPYDFASYRCNLLQLYFGDSADAPVISDLQISQRKSDDGTYHLVAQNGVVKIVNWPNFKLASAIASPNPQGLEVTALFEAFDSTTGELEIEGKIPTNTNEPLSLHVSAKDYPIQEILGEELGKRLQGVIQSSTGSLSYDYTKPSTSALSFELPFDSQNLTIKGLPFLSTLQQLTRNSSYSQTTFNIGSGNMSRNSSGIELKNLHLVSNSVMTLKGNLMVLSNDKLRGSLDIGIPTSVFEGTPPKPFVGPKDGLYFIKVELSGTIHNPHDNLREQLQANSQNQASPSQRPNSHDILQDPKEKMENDFNTLTR